MEDLPSNSQRAKRSIREEVETPAAEPKQLKKLIDGPVTRRKKPLGKRFREMFLGGDGPTVWEYVIQDIFVPAMRDMIVDAGIGGLERAVYGESRHSHRRPRQHIGGVLGGPVNYSGFANKPVGPRSVREDPRPALSRRARATHDFDEIVLDSRADAEIILDGLYAVLEQYDSVSVSDLYELLGQSGQFTDQRWGWTDLEGSRIERIRNGYVLNLPRTEHLER
jgi:hypothetical protein